MVELERNLLPTLSQYMTSWKEYIDDTILYVKVDCIEHVLNVSNSSHENISLTYEQVDVLIIRKKQYYRHHHLP